MVLVDSTIWIEFFKSNPSYLNDMEMLLESKNAYTIEPIFAELLFGTRNEKERQRILSYWKILPKLLFKEGSLIESADFAVPWVPLRSTQGYSDLTLFRVNSF